MTIAVTDACIFIDLLDLEITAEFFSLDLDIHTTIEVWNEIVHEQQSILQTYRSVGALTLHILEPEDFEKMETFTFPRALSEPDKSVVYVAKKLGAVLLTSDGPVRKFAEKQAIDRHGMFWILDELVDKGILSKPLAHKKLDQLTTNNLMYLNNVKLQKEIKKRLNDWHG